jgi:TRAP-type C4-dicarboxylate transport system permease small subunit
LEQFMPAGLRRWLEVAAGVVTVAVAVVVVVMAWRIVAGMLENDTRTVVLEIPLGIPYSAFIFGFALIALFALLRLIHLLRQPK